MLMKLVLRQDNGLQQAWHLHQRSVCVVEEGVGGWGTKMAWTCHRSDGNCDQAGRRIAAGAAPASALYVGVLGRGGWDDIQDGMDMAFL